MSNRWEEFTEDWEETPEGEAHMDNDSDKAEAYRLAKEDAGHDKKDKDLDNEEFLDSDWITDSDFQDSRAAENALYAADDSGQLIDIEKYEQYQQDNPDKFQSLCRCGLTHNSNHDCMF